MTGRKIFYLPRRRAFRKIACFAHDHLKRTTCRRDSDTGIYLQPGENGQQVLGMRLILNKRYITGAIATVAAGV